MSASFAPLLSVFALASGLASGAAHASIEVSEVGPTHGLVLASKDPRAAGDLRKLIQRLLEKGSSEIHDIRVLKTINFLKKTNIKVGAIVGFRTLDAGETQHSSERLGEAGGLHEWTELALGAHLSLPFEAAVPDLPAGMSATVKVGSESQLLYRFTSESSDLFGPLESIPIEAKEVLGRVLDSFRELKTTMDPVHLVPGSAFELSGQQTLAVGFGIGATEGIFEGNVGAYASIEGDFTTHVDSKSRGPGGEPRILVTVSQSQIDEIGAQAKAGIKVGWTWGGLTQQFKLNLLTAGARKNRSELFQLSFRFDLGYPGVESALREALQGNWIPAQRLATIEGDGREFHGILIERQSTVALLARSAEYFAGLGVAELELKIGILKLSIKENLSKLLSMSGAISTDDEIDTISNGPLRETDRRFTWHRTFEGHIAGGLINDVKRDVQGAATVEAFSDGEPGNGIESLELSYALKIHRKTFAKAESNRLLAFADTVLKELGVKNGVRAGLTGRCSAGGLDLELSGTLGQSELEMARAASDQAVTDAYTELAGHKPSLRFRTAWAKFQKGQTRAARAHALREIMEPYGWNPLPLGVVLLLARQAPAQGPSLPAWVHIGLQAKGCSVDQTYVFQRLGAMD